MVEFKVRGRAKRQSRAQEFNPSAGSGAVSEFKVRELAVGTADALEQLIVDAELRKRMGEAGRKRVAELFTEEAFEKRMKEILRDAIEFRV